MKTLSLIYLLIFAFGFSAQAKTQANFREIFNAFMDEAKIATDAVQKYGTGERKIPAAEDIGAVHPYDEIVYPALPQMLDADKRAVEQNPQASPGELIDIIGNLFNADGSGGSMMASDMFLKAQASRKQGMSAVSLKDIKENIRKEKVIVVLVPGYVGELNPTVPLAELLNDRTDIGTGGSTAFRKRFNDAMKTKGGTPDTMDMNFSLVNITSENEDKIHWRKGMDLYENDFLLDKKSLDNYFYTASMDDAEGPLVNMVLFDMATFSLESLQNIDKTAEIFLRRLDKFFRVIDHKDDEKIIFVGYSRGTAVSLEMFAQAMKNQKGDENAHPWLKDVKAMVSYSGVVYGSGVVDEMLVDGTDGHRTLVNLQYISKRFLGGEKITPQEKLEAAGRAMDFLSDQIISDLKAAGSTPAADIKKALESFVEMAKKYHQVEFGKLNLPVISKKLALVCDKLVDGMLGMSTRDRMQWWTDPDHNLPTKGIKYYSVGATMANKNSTPVESYLATSQVTFGNVTTDVDFFRLYGGYETFTRFTKIPLNDSQMAVHKASFWPELNKALNPYYAQNPMQAELLGIAGTHHWGIAYYISFKSKTGIANPYPRLELMKSIVGAVVEDLSQK